MSAPPFMRLFIADYLSDTEHLSVEEHGAYLLLIMHMWRAGGHLPNEPVRLARLLHIRPSQWAKLSVNVMPLFMVDGGKITSKRMLSEMSKAKKTSDVRSQAGSVGGIHKALKRLGVKVANATPLPSVSSHILDNRYTPLPPKPEPSRPLATALPEGRASRPTPPAVVVSNEAEPVQPSEPIPIDRARQRFEDAIARNRSGRKTA